MQAASPLQTAVVGSALTLTLATGTGAPLAAPVQHMAPQPAPMAQSQPEKVAQTRTVVSTQKDGGQAQKKPGHPVKVSTVSEWRRETRAAESAGQVRRQVDVPFFKCQVCGIMIGEGYVETELYLWPVCNQQVCLEEDYFQISSPLVLNVCGGCARRRQLPETLLAIRPEYWRTRYLLDEDGLGANRPVDTGSAEELLFIRKALRAQVTTCHQWLFFCFLASRPGLFAAILHNRAPSRKRARSARSGAGRQAQGSLSA